MGARGQRSHGCPNDAATVILTALSAKTLYISWHWNNVSATPTAGDQDQQAKRFLSALK